jgi:deoxyhypusine synthase
MVKKGEGVLGNMPKVNVDLSDHPDIKGFDLSGPLTAQQLLEAYSPLGLQASNLSRALEIIKAARREEATVFLTFTGNMVSSGVRDLIRQLVEHKMVDVVVTNAGGVEEDIAKCFAPFKLGTFDAPGRLLFEQGVHRIGNIFVPTDRYTHLEQFLRPTLDELFAKQKRWSPTELLKEVGLRLDHDESILTWAARNDLPVFCPGIQDGSFGEHFYTRTQRDKEFVVDISRENKIINDLANTADKTAVIALGGGIAKHFALLANIFREGADFAVYINTGSEHEGSDSGASPEEAVTWAKVKTSGMRVKVWCEASIAAPLLFSAWMQWEHARSKTTS